MSGRLAAINDVFDDASLAETVGIGRGAVAGWWRGAKPNGDTIFKLADATGLSPDELIRFLYQGGPPPTLPDPESPVAAGVQEGLRRDRTRQRPEDPDMPPASPEQRPRGTEAGTRMTRGSGLSSIDSHERDHPLHVKVACDSPGPRIVTERDPMNDATLLLIGLAVWLICAVGAYLITAQKGRDDAGSAAVMAFVLGPIGLVMAAGARPPRPDTIGRVCDHCGNVVAQDRERLCDHCGEPFAAADRV